MSPSPGSRLVVPALTLSRRVAPGITGPCQGVLRRHWPLLIVAGWAGVLRVIVLLAYQPTLIFPDSVRYLQYTQQYISGHWYPDWLRTSGYSLLLIPVVLIHNLKLVRHDPGVMIRGPHRPRPPGRTPSSPSLDPASGTASS
jgi:hypothetical protein